jgi:glycine cleavage system aminomethyltransferase T
MTDEIVSAIARAMADIDGICIDEDAARLLSALSAAGYEIVPAGAVAEARAETQMYAEWRDQWQAKAEALAKAADFVIGCDDEPWIGKDAQRRERNAMEELRTALSAFQQGGSGWRPEANLRAKLGEHINDTAARAFSRAMDSESVVAEHNDLRFFVKCYRPAPNREGEP